MHGGCDTDPSAHRDLTVVDSLLQWLSSLPVWSLYAALAAIAAIENIFPPFPADTVVAVGSFLAARGSGTLLGAAASIWAGNLVGAIGMYFVGRRLGSAALMKRLGGAGAEARVSSMYARHGLWALFVSRFLPGVRAVVPPFAGALRIPLSQVLPAMAVASAVWYGVIAWLGFKFGSNMDELTALIGRATRTSSAIAVVIVLGAGGAFWWRARHARREP
jgi:membrane protein DedA with SNARE-associated domain